MIGAGMVLPAIQTARLSVLSPDGRQFVGLSNFGWVLTSPNARQALANSLAWALAVPMASVILGLALALAVHRMRRRSLPLALLAMPMAMSYVGTCVAWLWLQPRSTPALMAIMTWVLAGLALLLLGAAIAAIPADILQAAQLDGAQGWLLLFR
jgi:alpha-glucoside transport system permease protein